MGTSSPRSHPPQDAQPGASSEFTASQRADWLRRLTALFGLLLIGATWPLWMPQTQFPQAPLLSPFAAAPAWLQGGVAAGQLLGLALALLAPAVNSVWRRGLLLFAGLTLLAVLFDQHRLQPWTYQLAIVGVVLAGCSAPRAGLLLRILTVSLYAFSAISKLDYVFLHTVGQQLLAALLDLVGLNAQQISEPTRLMFAALFPLGELLVAAALCFRPTRSIALVGAIAMHLGLLIAVGPWGLQHKPAVLVWNLFFIAQDLLLFARLGNCDFFGSRIRQNLEASTKRPKFWRIRLQRKSQPERAAPRSLAARLAHLLVAAAVLLPLAEPWGWWDHWLAWGLYAPKASRALVYVHRSAAERFPPDLQLHLLEEHAASPWLRLRLDHWSLAALDAPLYPQARFQLAVAEAVGRRYGLNRLIRVALLTRADRWTGARQQRTLVGLQAIIAAGRGYWFGAQPGALYLHRESFRRLNRS